ncbi:PIR protein CIR protein [Plasmodium vinckei vinckei]|uniref:PIR protein CIR protein n=1 Tax=Plasmodium vinckei vinckei TaxID=54757 RepID=A0A449BT60_PLAVN|nr:PIR protein CIR protein [Plasmodium vinckei vinckei]VEV56670.1 PIR protein CIR protein [Plasmodium vinckei vinckei]
MTPVYNLKTNIQSYGQTLKMCKLLLKGDSYFNDENVDTEEIKKNAKLKGYCSSNGCKTNEDGINAVFKYIYMEFKESIPRVTQHNHYDEYLLMWISDKLLKIHKKGKGKKIGKGRMDDFTLKRAYEEYLKKHKKGLDYWNLLNMKQGLKEANLWYMSEFYKLFNNICKTIVDYKDNGAKSKQLSKYSKNCLTQYRTLYKNISKCQSYLDLLNKLKGIYDDFRSRAIKRTDSKNDLKTKLIIITPEDGEEMEAVRRFISYDFSNSKCKLPQKKKKKASPPEPQPPPQSAQDGGSSKTSQTGGSNSQNVPKTSENSKENTGGGNDNEGGQSDGNGNPGDGSSDPASSTPGGSFDLGSSILKFILNGTDKLNKTSQFIQQNQKMFKDAKDKISSAYNDTVENLKNVYNVSSSHFNNIINNITSHLNQVGTPPKSSGKQSGPGSPIDGGNKLNQSPSNSQQNPPSPPPQQPPPPTPPQLPSPPIPTPITLPDPLKGSPQQKQPSSQSQTITQHPPQVPVKVNQPNHKTVVQFVKSLSSDLILKKPWNIFPTTWNGSGDCKPEIKFMNATLVCCTSEQCSLTGITVTLVLIPIILLIAYKYLSFGSSKKSEKKNMKKVINFHDGKRKTKIIISSNDRSKDLKPVINSIGGKKDSLINIYNIIQADPMPFINLFFLLIFFVYKRKRDTIE